MSSVTWFPIEYATSDNQKMITFWLGRHAWATKSLAALEEEKKGNLIPMIDNGIVMVTPEDLEILRLWK